MNMINIRLESLTDGQLLSSLKSETCPNCGGSKKERMTLCSRDYYQLSDPMRKALYKRIGQGYREAFVAALTQLGSTAAALD